MIAWKIITGTTAACLGCICWLSCLDAGVWPPGAGLIGLAAFWGVWLSGVVFGEVVGGKYDAPETPSR